jgi:hypothetical protein
MKYDSIEQANMRLQHTVVKYDGRPVLIKGVNGTGRGLDAYMLPHAKDIIQIKLQDPKLDVANLALGYVNVNDYAVYLTRIPGRQQKQGLCKSNVMFGQNGRNVDLGWQNLIVTPEFSDAFRGIYPSFNEVIERLYANEELQSMAFSRRFALEMDKELAFFQLLYRGQKIAWGDPQNFNLPSEYTYLSELIRQEGVNVR